MNMQVKGLSPRQPAHTQPDEKTAPAGGSSVAFAAPTGMPSAKRASLGGAAATGQAPRKTGVLPNQRATLPHMAPMTGVGPQQAPTMTGLRHANINQGFQKIKDPHRGPRIHVGSMRVDKQDLMAGTIPEMQKKLSVPARDLADLETAVSHFGAGTKLLFGGTHEGASALNPAEVARTLDYTTDRGVLSLAIAAHDFDELLTTRMLAGVSKDDVIDPITEEKPGDMSTGSVAESPFVKAAIAQGQSTAQIVKNPANNCVTATDIFAVHDAKIEHDKKNGV
jgi:hypothetical protein